MAEDVEQGPPEPTFDDVLSGWDDELRRQATSGELPPGSFSIWQAAKECIEKLADEYADDDDDDPDAAAPGYPRLLDTQNAAFAQLVTIWTEWAPILTNTGDPTVKQFVARFGAVLANTLRHLLPSAGVAPHEVEDAIASLPLVPAASLQETSGSPPANGRPPSPPPA